MVFQNHLAEPLLSILFNMGGCRWGKPSFCLVFSINRSFYQFIFVTTFKDGLHKMVYLEEYRQEMFCYFCIISSFFQIRHALTNF